MVNLSVAGNGLYVFALMVYDDSSNGCSHLLLLYKSGGREWWCVGCSLLGGVCGGDSNW